MTHFSLSVRLLLAVAVVTGGFLLPIQTRAAYTSSDVVAASNKVRSAQHVRALKRHPALDRAAYRRAQDMFKRQYFGHTSPNGRSYVSWLGRSLSKFDRIGENLAMGPNRADAVVKMWMSSAGHRKNLLNSSYNRVGVSVLRGKMRGRQTTLIVQMLGRTR